MKKALFIFRSKYIAQTKVLVINVVLLYVSLNLFFMKKALLPFLLFTVTMQNVVNGQGQAGAKLGPAYQAYIDSIKNKPYPYIFPIWGKRLAKKGFDLPLAAGIMA